MAAIVELERVRAARAGRPRPACPPDARTAADRTTLWAVGQTEGQTAAQLDHERAATTSATILLFTGVRYERLPWPDTPSGARVRDVIVLD